MANRDVHIAAGVSIGLGYSTFQAKDQGTPNLVTEMIGGAVGGYVGGILPDLLEPAISSWHRETAHSCTVAAGIIASRDMLVDFQDFCRRKADACAEKIKTLEMQQNMETGVFAVAPVDPIALFFLKMEELFWRFVAGAANGLAAGYLSHLALDAVTPRSIPVLP
jgi:hypothetical protein